MEFTKKVKEILDETLQDFERNVDEITAEFLHDYKKAVEEEMVGYVDLFMMKRSIDVVLVRAWAREEVCKTTLWVIKDYADKVKMKILAMQHELECAT